MGAKEKIAGTKGGFGTTAVYLTAISSILGAVLFLRMGYAAGMVGFWGITVIIIVGHMITIPTALAISELATNTRVEGGGEYFIISRSFGLKLGSTIGLALFLSQAISIAFYTVAFAEAFEPLFNWWAARFGFELPRQVVSVPTLLIISSIILKQGAGSGMKMLYVVTTILILSLGLFFIGKPIEVPVAENPEDIVMPVSNFGFFNRDQFFIIFAICFPAFTGMTAGVGLSGDLKDPGRSIPFGTMAATLTGLVIYMLVALKLSVSAPQADLVADQMIMSRIALYGSLVIPIGLAASTSSSAIGAMMVAPRTLQAIAGDRVFPFHRINLFLARGRGETREPRNASLITFAIALIFVVLGDVNSVAVVISMFFLITYGTLCLSSFLNHFGSPPSYRPRFLSKWYISLGGFLMSVWVMFMIDPFYTVVAYILLILIYLYIEHYNKEQPGLVNIFKGALFQLNRQLQVYLQRHQAAIDDGEWRPAALCVSSHTLEREKVLDLMKWISYQHGFGTYFHYIEWYFNRQACIEAREIQQILVEKTKERRSTLYVDTMISPSFTSAIAQIIQSPSISGMDNNLVIFEYDRRNPDEVQLILDNMGLVRAGRFDVGMFAMSEQMIRPSGGIHVWITETDGKNTNFMILLGYIIMSHPDWKRSHIKIFIASSREDRAGLKKELEYRIAEGRLPITLTNIEIVQLSPGQELSDAVERYSAAAGLIMMGFHESIGRSEAIRLFTGFRGVGDILFVNTPEDKDIS